MLVKSARPIAPPTSRPGHPAPAPSRPSPKGTTQYQRVANDPNVWLPTLIVSDPSDGIHPPVHARGRADATCSDMDREAGATCIISHGGTASAAPPWHHPCLRTTAELEHDATRVSKAVLIGIILCYRVPKSGEQIIDLYRAKGYHPRYFDVESTADCHGESIVTGTHASDKGSSGSVVEHIAIYIGVGRTKQYLAKRRKPAVVLNLRSKEVREQVAVCVNRKWAIGNIRSPRNGNGL